MVLRHSTLFSCILAVLNSPTIFLRKGFSFFQQALFIGFKVPQHWGIQGAKISIHDRAKYNQRKFYSKKKIDLNNSDIRLDSGKFSMRVSGEKKIGHPIPKSAVMSETG
jgi:hypothetical protein